MSALSLARSHPLHKRIAAHPLFTLAAPALGYGCFRGASALAYTAGSSVHSPAILFAAHPGSTTWATLFVTVVALIACGTSLVHPGSRPRARHPGRGIAIVALASLAMVGTLVATLAATAEPGGPLPPGLLPATLYAVGGTALSLMWLCTLVRYGAVRCIASFVGGMAVLAGISLVSLFLNPVVRTALALVLLALHITLFAYVQRSQIASNIKIFSVSQTAHTKTVPTKRLRTELVALAAPLLITVALECVFGFLGGFLAGIQSPFNNRVAFTLGATTGVIYALVNRSVPACQEGFRRLFPLVITVVVLAPFVDTTAAGILGAAFGFLYIALTIQAMACILALVCKQPSRALEMLGIVTCIRYVGRGFCVATGIRLGELTVDIAQGLLVVSLVGVYVLGLVLWRTNRGFVADATVSHGTQEPGEPFEHRAAALARIHRLTPREQQVCALIARGRSAAVIGEELSCTPATVRTHTKNLYVKLGVHSKQELIDLFESTDIDSA